ncbi:MAG: hypothetical protein AB7O24_26155, partial [Kofleriaceae bacterium]
RCPQAAARRGVGFGDANAGEVARGSDGEWVAVWGLSPASLVATPTLLAAFAIVIQTHPAPVFRNGTLLLSCLGVAAPALLELVHSTAYSFDAGRMIISPQMHELPPTLTILLMTIASLGMIVTPCIVVSRLRTSLEAAQRQVRVQAWHFQRLGTQLIDVKQARSVNDVVMPARSSNRP